MCCSCSPTSVCVCVLCQCIPHLRLAAKVSLSLPTCPQPMHACRTQAQAKKATATAKKAVSHVKEVAHELNVQQVLTKHKLPFEASPSGRGTAEGGDVPRPLFEVLRRSTGEVREWVHHELGCCENVL